MISHNHKLDHANVVGVFGHQDDAEETMLGLRLAGFPDARIGYFARDLVGLVTDYTWKGHTGLGALIGGVVGAVVGLLAGIYARNGNASHIGPTLIPGEFGVVLSAVIVGAVVLGLSGAFLGWGVPKGDTIHKGIEVTEGRYVIAVEAGDRRRDAWEVMARHGGHPPQPRDGIEIAPAT